MKFRPAFIRIDIIEFFRWVQDNQTNLVEAVNDLAKGLIYGDAKEGSYAKKLLDEAQEFHNKKSAAGRKGNESRWGSSQENDKSNPYKVDYVPANPANGPPKKRAPTRIPPPRNKQEVFDFANEKGIPDWAVITWWEQNYVERDGCDKDGTVIDNWKGALTNFHKSELKKERKNG